MLKYAIAFAATFGLMTFAGASTASAQFTDQVVTHVPFSFIVDGQVLPAGNYRLQADDLDANVMWVTNTGNPADRAIAVTLIGGQMVDTKRARLVFETVGSEHVLSKVEIPGQDDRFIPLSRAELTRQLTEAARQRAADWRS